MTESVEPAWLHDAVISGLQALLAIRLKGSPSMETVPATAQIWVIAIRSRNISWDEKLDGPRINKAFVDLAATAETWPSPAAFIARLQPRQAQPSLDYPKNNTMSPATRALIDKVLEKTRRYRRSNA